MAEEDLYDLLIRQLTSMGFLITGEGCERLVWFLQEMGHWNRHINLTAITDPVEGVEKHLIDSLTLLPMLRGDETLLDIGSGGGFPGIPLKIALPELEILSIDAVRKKVDFQVHVARRLALKGFEARHGRAEEMGRRKEWAGGFEVITSRAFATLVDFARVALPFFAPGGRLLAMKGSSGERELTDSLPELTRMGLVSTDIQHVFLPVSGAARTLISLQRIGDRHPSSLGANTPSVPV